MKRYFLEFDIDIVPRDRLPENEGLLIGGCWDYTIQDYNPAHVGGGWNGNSLKTMMGYISRIKKNYHSQHPHNFRIFDRMAPDEPCGHVGQVFFLKK